MKYSSNQEQQFIQHRRWIARWFLGLEVGWKGKTRQLSNHIRRYLLEITRSSCELCGWNVLHPTDNKPLVEIDHIDGNAENCNPSNLIVLCPNCHSMTPTFRARNKNSKRCRS
jgi:hypothetical protein